MFNRFFDRAVAADPDDDPRLFAPQDPDLRNLYSEARQSRLLRYLAFHLASGIVIGTAAVGGLLAVNPGGIRTVIFADDASWLAISLLLFGFVLTFSSFVVGTAIMAIGSSEEEQ